MFPTLCCLKGMWSQWGHWFGCAHSGGSELSNCVGDVWEEGEKKEIKERKREDGSIGCQRYARDNTGVIEDILE